MNAFIKQSAICAAMLGLCVGMASATSWEMTSAYGEENDLPNPVQSTLLAGNADLNEQLEATAAGIPLDLAASRFDMSRP
ncbi:MAG: hypothetical protein RLZZ596_37 [Pseudomonadota bacterium]|jgi:VIT1/CCC1 family predicted Fe2+/Mn2+ transporter